MAGRMPPPFSAKREETRDREAIKGLIPSPTGGGDDLGDQVVEVDFPEPGDASDAAVFVFNPDACAIEGSAANRSATEKVSARNSS